jgi:hypothetical protein
MSPHRIAHPVDTGASIERIRLFAVGHGYRISRPDHRSVPTQARALAGPLSDVEPDAPLDVEALPHQEDDTLGWFVGLLLAENIANRQEPGPRNVRYPA